MIQNILNLFNSWWSILSQEPKRSCLTWMIACLRILKRSFLSILRPKSLRFANIETHARILLPSPHDKQKNILILKTPKSDSKIISKKSYKLKSSAKHQPSVESQPSLAWKQLNIRTQLPRSPPIVITKKHHD